VRVKLKIGVSVSVVVCRVCACARTGEGWFVSKFRIWAVLLANMFCGVLWCFAGVLGLRVKPSHCNTIAQSRPRCGSADKPEYKQARRGRRGRTRSRARSSRSPCRRCPSRSRSRSPWGTSDVCSSRLRFWLL